MAGCGLSFSSIARALKVAALTGTEGGPHALTRSENNRKQKNLRAYVLLRAGRPRSRKLLGPVTGTLRALNHLDLIGKANG